MKRSEVPVEKFEPSFKEAGLEDAKKAKEDMVTILRFFDRDISPKIEAQKQTLPDLNEIERRELRTEEDGRFFLGTAEAIDGFIEEVEKSIYKYLGYALMGISNADGEYLKDQLFKKFELAIAPMVAVSAAARGKFESYIESAQTAEPFPEERNEVEDAVREAGTKYRTPLGRLIK